MTSVIEHIERATGEDPTVTIIWLHGLGADGHDFEPIVPELGLPATPVIRFIFPHAPLRPVTVNGGMVMRAWYDVKAVDLSRREDPAGIEESDKLIQQLIVREEKRGIAPGRIFLAGFSQGGAISLHTGLRYSKPLAGIIALSTYLPLAERFTEEANTANQNVPIFMAHGMFDPVIPVVLGDRSHQLLQGHGYQVEWHTYPMQHSVSLDEISDLGEWLRHRLAAVTSS